MKMRITGLFIASLFCAASALSSQELRNYFEWGEYQQLIDSLEPKIITVPCGSDSLLCAQYHNYLGVAYYGKGRVGDAQMQFRQALSYRADVYPDSNYLPAELNGLYTVIRSEFLEKLSRVRSKDSLLVAEKEAFSANVNALRREAVQKTRRSGMLLSVSFYTLSAAFAAAAGYEYWVTRQPYADFTAAANGGDKIAYDRLHPEIRRANGIVSGCAAGAATSIAAGLTFTIRTIIHQ